jgi:glycerol-1-phosphate dehydrogenase [NAD(P)+]
MTATVPEFRYDPADMAALRGKLQALPEAARFTRFELDRVEVGPDALLTLPAVLDDLTQGPGPVLVVQDATPMRRGDEDLKVLVHRLLADVGREVRTVVLEAGEGGQAHADEHTVDQVLRELQPGLSVVSVGSGTVTDVAKHAVFRHDESHERLPLVFVATANTMVAYTARMAVIAKHGVKRTHKSRLADALIMDTTILRDAPPESGLAGIGDAAAMYVSFGDWWLGKRFGLGNYLEASSDLIDDVRAHLLPYASSMGERSPVGLEVQSRLMVLCGLSATIAGESAPLSGYEHVVSHMLDMSAAHYGRPVGTHGAQVGMAVLPCSIAFNLLIDELDPADVDVDASYPGGAGPLGVRQRPPDAQPVLQRGSAALPRPARRGLRGPGLHPHARADRTMTDEET